MKQPPGSTSTCLPRWIPSTYPPEDVYPKKWADRWYELNLEHFTDSEQLLSVTAYVNQSTDAMENLRATNLSIKTGWKLWIISEQTRDSLLNTKEFVKTKENLRIFEYSEGVMWCQGRLAHSVNCSCDTKHPIYIPAVDGGPSKLLNSEVSQIGPSPSSEMLVLQSHGECCALTPSGGTAASKIRFHTGT